MPATRREPDDLADLLRPNGLVVLGWRPFAEATPARAAAGMAAIVGNAGPGLWRAFQGSPEARAAETGAPADARANPLDLWTRRVVDEIARGRGARAVYPFDGPPYHPFQRWTVETGAAAPSPVGLLVHRRYGLWFALRAALLFEGTVPANTVDRADGAQGVDDAGEPPSRPAPCASCAARPCLGACPVGAFADGRYDAEGCAAHVASPEGARCRTAGCLVRHACPVGQNHAYAPDQAKFHMTAFLRGRSS